MLDSTEKNLDSIQLRRLTELGARVNRFGVNFAVCNSDCELVLLCEDNSSKMSTEQFSQAGLQALNQNSNKGPSQNKQTEVCKIGDDGQFLAAVFRQAPNESAFVAIIGPVADEKARYLSEILLLLAESFQIAENAADQVSKISTELGRVYEELVLLYKLSTNMKVTEPDSNYLQMACDSLTDIIQVEGIAILLEKIVEGECRFVLAAGSGVIDVDEQTTALLSSRLIEEIDKGKEALLDSDVCTPFKYDWSENIKSVIAVPLFGKDEQRSHLAKGTRNSGNVTGLMVAVNRKDKADFDSMDVKLFSSVANGCAVFMENGRLFTELEELFVGSLKALTSSIDAKDPYTRGHSERVAFISRWIAEKLEAEGELDEEQIHKVYLAGLLHDIGKMGINESILRKKSALTESERDRIRTHPSVGAGILTEIKQMRDIVPAILHHHERIDGTGYPDGLSGDQIPMLAKIVGLADSLDAMTSRRTYRDEMSLEQAIREIEKGLGTQFDEKVAKALMNSDVYQLWSIMQNGFAGLYGVDNLPEYGTMAVGALIR